MLKTNTCVLHISKNIVHNSYKHRKILFAVLLKFRNNQTLVAMVLKWLLMPNLYTSFINRFSKSYRCALNVILRSIFNSDNCFVNQ